MKHSEELAGAFESKERLHNNDTHESLCRAVYHSGETVARLGVAHNNGTTAVQSIILEGIIKRAVELNHEIAFFVRATEWDRRARE